MRSLRHWNCTRTLSKNASPPCRSTAAYIFSFLSAFPVLYLAYRTEIWRDKDGKKKSNRTEILKEILILTAAVAIIAAAVYFFLVPSHTSVSSISGLGIVLSNFIPLPLSAITMVLNIVLLIIGFITCGREFGTKTVYTLSLIHI